MSGFDVQDLEFPALDGQALPGRLYRPRCNAPVPLLVDVHGGAWIRGNRLNNASMHEALADEGIATFALDFRMPSQAAAGVTFADVQAGLDWARGHADALGSRPEWVGGLGTSSGGHLLMLNALLGHAPGVARPDSSVPLPGYAIVCWPILDPLEHYRMARERQLAPLLDAHHAFWPDEAAMERDNPQRIIERGDARHLPPVLLIQGTADATVDPLRADAFGEQYRRAGGAIDVLKYDDEPHMFITVEPDSPASLHAMDRIRQFARNQCRAAG
ncbi:MAG: alpha/beta hydrolase [Alcaligenaceae bacterium]|nr:alpha/beta hydrolase [Alcaligenaceae bacterium SAGV5]MPS53217.1 alpha/beta hydrolase [Alcaligenaceae bacterium SAGV3]MPT55345.1 alpha/beta hydrolase [Alcaligenaceae bacterium]